MSSHKSAFLAFICAVLIALPGQASLLTISESDTTGIIITFSGPAGFTINAAGVESVTFTLTSPTVPTGSTLSMAATTASTLVEPGTNLISDQLNFLGFSSFTSAQYQFLSDSDTGSLGICRSGCIEETGGFQTLANLTFTSTVFATGVSTILDTVIIQVQSDLETRAVPEPGTAALFATALGLFGLRRKRRQR